MVRKFSQKHYVVIAEVLRISRNRAQLSDASEALQAIDDLTDDLITTFAADSSKFDSTRFVSATLTNKS